MLHPYRIVLIHVLIEEWFSLSHATFQLFVLTDYVRCFDATTEGAIAFLNTASEQLSSRLRFGLIYLFSNNTTQDLCINKHTALEFKLRLL